MWVNKDKEEIRGAVRGGKIPNNTALKVKYLEYSRIMGEIQWPCLFRSLALRLLRKNEDIERNQNSTSFQGDL